MGAILAHRLSRYGLALVTLMAGIAIGLGASALATHDGTGQVIHACVGNQSGIVRIMASGDSCRPSESPIQWNIQGPKGDAGPIGPAGSDDPVTVVRVDSPTVQLEAGEIADLGPTCERGYILTGGGWRSDSRAVYASTSEPIAGAYGDDAPTPLAYVVKLNNPGATPSTVQAYALCALR